MKLFCEIAIGQKDLVVVEFAHIKNVQKSGKRNLNMKNVKTILSVFALSSGLIA
jgi:hypothetical protein